MATKFVNKNKFVSPVLTVVRESLLSPKVYTNNGQTNTKFELKVYGQSSDTEATAFFQELMAAEKSHKGTNEEGVVRPRIVKNRSTNEFENHPSDLSVVFRSNDLPTVLELTNGKYTLADNIQLPSGTKIVIEGEITKYAIPNRSGEGAASERKGISLTMRTIKVVERRQGRDSGGAGESAASTKEAPLAKKSTTPF